MRAQVASTLFILALTGTGLGLQTSQDATCGGNTGNTCAGSAFGNCCSQYGWCGNDSAYCGSGCQSGFGKCSSSQTSVTSTANSTSSSPTQPASSCPTFDATDMKKQRRADGEAVGGGASASSVTRHGSTSSPVGNEASGAPVGDSEIQADESGDDSDDGGNQQPVTDGSDGSSSNPNDTDTPASCSSPTSTSPVSTTATPTSTPMPATLSQCLAAANVPSVLPASGDYANLAKPYNNRLPWKPAVIVLATTVKHVQDAVLCASAAKVKVQARSGGHSYAAFGLGGHDGSMMIDLQGMQSISLDSKNVAKVGGGVRLGNLANTLYNQGKRALSHGTCPGVGIGGHFTHGGFGYSSRAWGLALDHIQQLEVVTADGKVVMASATQNKDLFYALRGAAESFGIVTTFYLRTQAAPSAVVNWSFGFADQFSNAAVGSKTMLRIQDFARNGSVVDRKLGMGVYLDGETFSLSGTYFGTLDEFNNKVKPEMLRGMPTPASQSVQSVDWITSLQMLSGESTIVVPTDTGSYDHHDNFLAKSLVVPESSPITKEAMKQYFQTIKNKAAQSGSAWFSIFNLYGGPDSQINAVSAADSSYSDRSALWVIQNYGYVSVDQSPFPLATVNTYLSSLGTALKLRSSSAFGAYVNYVDPTLTAAEAHDQYYGPTTYAKLQAIKKTVDPGQLFWNPQAVTTA